MNPIHPPIESFKASTHQRLPLFFLKIPQSQSTLVNVGEPNHTLITSPTIIHPHHLLFLIITSTVVSPLLKFTPQSQTTLTLYVTVHFYSSNVRLCLRNSREQAVIFVVVEWSGALNPSSLQQRGAEFEGRRVLVNAQLALFDKYCGGWFFWKYKKEHRGDPGWSWQDAVEGGIFPTSVGIKY